MIEGTGWLCNNHFGKNLIDQGLEIRDPANANYRCKRADCMTCLQFC